MTGVAPMSSALDGLKLIRTLNGTGFDMGVPSYRIEEWISAYDGEKPLYDIGSGWGTNTMVALKKGAKVVAIDMNEDHLAHIRKEAGEAVERGDLRTVYGKLPDGIALEDQSASGVLCAQVLHFLEPKAVMESLQCFYRWLKPGGKAVVLACSHYVALLTTEQMEAIESSTVQWDGYELYEQNRQKANALLQIPEPYHDAVGTFFRTFSVPQLRFAAETAGFVVDSCEYAPGQLSGYPPWVIASNAEERFKDKEMVVVIATRPL